MERFYGVTGWLLTALGVLLLACSVLLVPNQPLLAQSTGGCAGTGMCDDGCTGASCVNNLCSVKVNSTCTCSQTKKNQCSTCKCVISGLSCACNP